MSALDWRLLGSCYVVKDRWVALRADTYRLPDGRVIEPCYVLEYRDWVNIVALTRKQEVVLVRQFRSGIGRTILELPGGTTDPEDSSPLAAARRELLEETGYAGEDFIKLGHVSANPANHNNLTYVFLAVDVERIRAPHLDQMEHLETVLMPLAEAIEAAKASELPQALHVAALFLALAKLGRIG
jgi:8-oxo-dGTP pyrophosphatase MutT (NUDIX family)